MASLVMSSFMIFDRGFKKTKFNFSLRLGKVFLGHFTRLNKYFLIFGQLIHIIIGIFWGVFYALAMDSLHLSSNIFSGAIFSLLPWLTMMLVFLPMVGEGIFGKDFSHKIRDRMLFYHIAYGIALGFLAGL